MHHRAAPISEPLDQAESWREHWFPVAFLADLEPDQLHRISIFDTGYVLFEAGSGVVGLLDRCPHRAARLSDGRLRDGEVECQYHGWRFGDDGRCVRIPQLEPGLAVPATACAQVVPVAVRQGLVWVYGGTEVVPDAGRIPTIETVDRGDCRCIDFAIDLPYGQDYLVENVLDIAHIHIAHHGVRGGGHRELAGPLAFDVSAVDAGGFSGRFGASRDGGLDTGGELDAARVEFIAPNLVHYVSVYRDQRRYSGLALYSVPLQSGGCRLLYRTYSNFWPWRDRIRPRFWEHGYQCHLLEQDMAIITGQAEEIRMARAPLGDLWLPLKSSDTLVLKYREWLDAFAGQRPGYVGFRDRGREPAVARNQSSVDRFSLHTRHCASCSSALRRARWLRRWLPMLAFTLLAAGLLVSSYGWRCALVALALSAQATGLCAAAVCRRLGAG